MLVEANKVGVRVTDIVPSLIVNCRDIASFAPGDAIGKCADEIFALVRRCFQWKRDDKTLADTPSTPLCISLRTLSQIGMG